jgi:hypothetical protein
MRIGAGITKIVSVVAVIAGASLAHADAPCDKGYRDTTPAERATMTTVLAAAKKALPAPPAGWMLLGDDNFSVPSSLCRDLEASPWYYEFTRYYQRTDDQEARNKVIADAASKAAADMKLKKPRLDALMAKMTKLSEQQAAAVQKGDMKRAEALGVDSAKVEEEDN